jgi:hypothetical protein
MTYVFQVIKPKVSEWADMCHVWETGKVHMDFLVGKPLGRPRHRWEDNIKTDLKERSFEAVDWIDLAQENDSWLALVDMVVNFRVLKNVGNS